MGFCVRVYEGEKNTDFSLEGREIFSVGGRAHNPQDNDGRNDYTFDIDTMKKSYIKLYLLNGKWYITSIDSNLINNDKEINDGDFYTLDVERKYAVSIFKEHVGQIKKLELNGRGQVFIGRSDGCEMQLEGNDVSRRHARVYLSDGRYCIEDNESVNHVFVNGARIYGPTTLNDGDKIAIANHTIKYKNGVLELNNVDEQSREERMGKYPFWYKPAPRLRWEQPKDTIEIDNPPQVPAKPDEGFIQRLAMPMVSIMALCVLAYITVSSTITMLIFTLPMSVVTIIFTIVNHVKGKKKYREALAKREEKYTQYLDDKEKKISETAEIQRKALVTENPPMDKIYESIKKTDGCLWDRTAADDDFLLVRVGIGDGDASFSVKGPKDGFVLDEDKLLDRARSMVENSKEIEDVPIFCDINKDRLIGILGDRENSLEMAFRILIQLAYHQSYEYLRIVTVCSENELSRFSWLRWLPHSLDESRQVRFISAGAGKATLLLNALDEMLKHRTDNSSEKGIPLPFYLFVFTQTELTEHQMLVQRILEHENIGAGALFLFDEMYQLPYEVQTIIEVNKDGGEIFRKNDSGNRKKFKYDIFETEYCEWFSRSLAPLRIPREGSAASLPTAITFLEGYGVDTPEQINIAGMWNSTRTEDTMAVPIGIQADGQPFLFDINEKQHGPHGLVAGMTGSGKSEMVQSWILSMALRFSPQEVSFILVDFKGTGLILPFKELPHLAGTISDLDTKISRNLRALENELKRRKALFDEYKVSSIRDYLKKYHAGEIKEPLPFLFVVVDEFAEFRSQFPDAMELINSIYRIGRTLGVFCILLMQKPSGVVTEQMRSNSKFFWCLKVASSADSKEMMLRPDAASINVPGRAFVRVGENDVFEQVQTFYSGAPYMPEVKDKAAATQKPAILELSGKRIRYDSDEEEEKKESKEKEIDAIVKYIKTYADKAGIKKAEQIWLSKLSDKIILDDIAETSYADGKWDVKDEGLCPIIGMIDDPSAQSQYPLKLDFSEWGHIAVFGAPGTGKTSLLQTAVMSMVRTYSPEELNIYIMDFGSLTMGIFKDFPHVGGVALDSEEEKIIKLTEFLKRQLAIRRELFSEQGVGSLSAYNQVAENKLPSIVLVLDNFAPVYQLYPTLDTFFLTLSQQGGNYGIYWLVATGTQMSLTFKLNQNIKMALALNMIDKTDYASIVGKTNGLEPENSVGRGLVKTSSGPLEFQAALPAQGEEQAQRTASIRELGKKMKAEYHGKHAAPIPIMPTVIEADSISPNAIGLSVAHVEPVMLPEELPHYFAVVGQPGSGKTNMLKVLAQMAIDRGEEVHFIDVNKKAVDLSEKDGMIYSSDIHELDSLMQQMATELQKRKDAKDNEVFKKIWIFIDDYRAARDVAEDDTIKRLTALIRSGEGLGVTLIIAESTEMFGKIAALGETVSSMMTHSPLAFLIGGNISQYSVFHVDVPSGEKTINMDKNEGYMIDHGNAIKLRIIKA